MQYLALTVPTIISQYLGWWLFAIILLIGIGIGLADILRLSWMRIWAISGVCFDESIRRRVLLIAPLAILGVIIISQLQRPIDELDAIRQTIKFSVFATGLVVAITTIILAATNLPREIENRVIFTVVTKPTTRLEIVMGKVLGFARVSFTILLIMGACSYVYLKLRAIGMERDIAQRLKNNEVPAVSVGTLQYYRDAGLLNVKTLRQPVSLQIYGKPPHETGSRRYFAQAGHGYMMAGFDVPPDAIPADEDKPRRLLITTHIGFERPGAATQPATTQTAATTGPTTVPYYGPFIMSPEERAALMAGTRHTTAPTVSIELVDAEENSLSMIEPVNDKIFELVTAGQVQALQGQITDPKALEKVRGRVFVKVTSASGNVLTFVDLGQTPAPVSMEVQTITMGQDGRPQGSSKAIAAMPNPLDPSKPAEPIFRSRRGNFGQQIAGGTPAVGVFEFRGASPSAGEEGAPFELRAGIERSSDEDAGLEKPTEVAVQVLNRATGDISTPVIVQPENSRVLFFRMPANALHGGDFDVLVRTQTKSDFLGVQPTSLALIINTQPFAWNLAKSMLILWLMSVLVTTVAIFCSTFLSWPIAVVLTLVILLGHWGVQQLGDALAPGIGQQVVTDFNLKNPAKAEAVRQTVERLSWFLNFISTILPDISKFPAVEDVARGVAISPATLRDAAGVTIGFTLPLILLAYVFLKNKEVAP